MVLVGSATIMGDWLRGAFETLTPFVRHLFSATGVAQLILVMVGVTIIGHLFRVLFGRGGVE